MRLLLAEDRTAARSDRPEPAHRPTVDALLLLDRLHAAAAEAGREGSLIEIRMLQALAHHAQGDEPQAMAALEQALGATPEPDSYVRLYLDEGTPMLDLLHSSGHRTRGLAPRAA